MLKEGILHHYDIQMRHTEKVCEDGRGSEVLIRLNDLLQKQIKDHCRRLGYNGVLAAVKCTTEGPDNFGVRTETQGMNRGC